LGLTDQDRQARSEGVLAVQFVRAVGRDQEDAVLGDLARQEAQEVERGLVCPVHVLQD
jgi:hypothetical protein